MGTLILGGVFYCGWACPMGTLQDIGTFVGRAFKIKKRRLPDWLHKPMVYSRYIIAVLTMVVVADFVDSLLSLEPRMALLMSMSGRVAAIGAISSIVVFFLLSIKYDRVYCKYVCPEGARYGAISMVRPFTIIRHEDKCVDCGRCDLACPMQIQVSKAGNLRSPQCINCFQCISQCPVDGALTYGFSYGKKKKAS